ncbi:helix-turn-helix transcriptional regulator [Aliiroseovarius sediminis]|uniref:helix-turn-helix domain-containing protein n=1 Tax=Aliiroseovarius sediminis TaxID=2925839 RepID=UPI001F5A6D8C|nr:helix-turn-helix transcriptional regulator [Aliiroseovarius sediminis]MCI2395066.1 helix-turn-helix domain-containing protein [Aliiroseovarius sediminis]
MAFSPTANNLSDAIDASGLTQREIADRVGFNHPNVLSMMKQGVTRVPLQRIPALAQTLGMDPSKFLLVAIEEYHPGVHEVLCDVLGLPLTDAEMGVVLMFRMACMRGDIELEGPFKKALEGLMEMAELASASR